MFLVRCCDSACFDLIFLATCRAIGVRTNEKTQGRGNRRQKIGNWMWLTSPLLDLLNCGIWHCGKRCVNQSASYCHCCLGCVTDRCQTFIDMFGHWCHDLCAQDDGRGWLCYLALLLGEALLVRHVFSQSCSLSWLSWPFGALQAHLLWAAYPEWNKFLRQLFLPFEETDQWYFLC